MHEHQHWRPRTAGLRQRMLVLAMTAALFVSTCGATTPAAVTNPPSLREILEAWPPPCPRVDAADDAWSARELIACAADRRRRLPRVPFFIYDGAWLGGSSAAAELAHVESECPDAVVAGTTYAPYRGDVIFLRQLLRHPWRVREPHEAVLLVPPVFLSLASSGVCAAYLMPRAQRVLDAVLRSELFHARRAAHVFCAPWWGHDWFARGLPPAGTVWALFISTHTLQRRFHIAHNYTMVVVPQSLSRSTKIPAATQVLGSSRPLPIFFAGRAGDMARKGSGLVRLPIFRAMAALMERTSESGAGALASPLPHGGALLVRSESKPQQRQYARAQLPLAACPGSLDAQLALAARLGSLSPPRPLVCEGNVSSSHAGLRAQFMLYLRGDHATTRRIQDCAVCGAIPVVICDGAFETGVPFQPVLPYEHLTLELREADALADPSAAIGAAVAGVSARRAARMRELLMHFRPDLLWEDVELEDEAMVARDAAKSSTEKAKAAAVGGVARRPSRVAENVLLRAAIALGRKTGAAAAADASRYSLFQQPDRQVEDEVPGPSR